MCIARAVIPAGAASAVPPPTSHPTGNAAETDSRKRYGPKKKAKLIYVFHTKHLKLACNYYN